MNIKISQVKKWREEIDATHIVVFAMDNEGIQRVATHGKTEQHAKEAADAGNRLKDLLGWPEDLCQSTPLKRICSNCVYFKPDRGVFCVNGWSQDGKSGHCQENPIQQPQKNGDDRCFRFDPKL